MDNNMADKGIFAKKLERLFQTVRKPDGTAYTEIEVQAGAAKIGERITHTYVRRLRDGTSQNPSYEKIKALSRFFGVSPNYFFAEEEEEAALAASAGSADMELRMESIAMRADQVEDEALKEAMLQMLSIIKETREEVQRRLDAKKGQDT